MLKEFSIIISLKNRTIIEVDYESIPLRILQRNQLLLSGLNKQEIKVSKDGKIVLKLLLNFLESLQKIKNKDESFEIIISDFGSTDYNLNNLQKLFSDLEIKIIQINGYFCRGKGLNEGYKHATKKNIFFADADMLLTSRKLIDDAYNEINNGKVFFPICFDLCEPSHQIGYERKSGYGLSLMNRNIIEKYNIRFPEYDSLGKEDDDLYDIANKLNLCSRYRPDGYYHQYHPATIVFKNQYYKHNDITKTKIFINCKNTLTDEQITYILKELKITENYYLTFKLEKYVDVVVSILNNNMLKIVDNNEINNYIKKHNKNLKHHLIEL